MPGIFGLFYGEVNLTGKIFKKHMITGCQQASLSRIDSKMLELHTECCCLNIIHATI